MSKQVVIIHGGDTFGTYDEYFAYLKSIVVNSIEFFLQGGWKYSLQEELGPDFEVIMPQMPNKANARYAEWKVWFEKLLPLLNDSVTLVGHSLGGIFIVKYLAENNVNKKITKTLLVAAPFDSSDSEYTLADFELPENLSGLIEQGGDVVLYHSRDDKVVPFIDLEKYKHELPNAKVRVFEDRGHFKQEKFPELVEDIKIN